MANLAAYQCIGSPEVAALPDDEFWDFVFNRGCPSGPWEPSEDDEVLDEPAGTCSVCLQTGACGYDSNGDPWIHAQGWGEPDA